MATATHIQLNRETRGIFHTSLTSEKPEVKASEMLQEDMLKHHVFFTKDGLHNHIPHHILTLYALNAPSSVLERHYSNNASYQRDPLPTTASVVDSMQAGDLKKFRGKEANYPDFLAYYQAKIDDVGVGNCVNEALFAGTEDSDDLLARLFAGFFHPLIQFGFGVEFEQPAIIAEGLAQASVHADWMHKFLFESERLAKESPCEDLLLIDLLQEVAKNETLKSSVQMKDGNKTRDGLLKRAPDEMIRYAAKWTVKESDVERRTAEMIDACGMLIEELRPADDTAYFTAAAQNPPKEVKFDFFYMHCVTTSIFFSSFLKQSWLTETSKVRLLEWKGRCDLAQYVSRGSSKLIREEVTQYTPRYNAAGGGDGWESMFHRVWALDDDDGHAAKLLRAIAHGEQVCKTYEGLSGFSFNGNMWQQVGNMIIDSVEAGSPTWVRSTGFEEAWKDVPERSARLQR